MIWFLKQLHSPGVEWGIRMYIFVELWAGEWHKSCSHKHCWFFLPSNLHSLSIILLWSEKIWHLDNWILDSSCLLWIWPFWNYFPEDTSLEKNFFLFLAWNFQQAALTGISKHNCITVTWSEGSSAAPHRPTSVTVRTLCTEYYTCLLVGDQSSDP